jgi:hypothetical protein
VASRTRARALPPGRVGAPRGDALMDSFYARLFATAPAVEPLIAGSDLRRQ